MPQNVVLFSQMHNPHQSDGQRSFISKKHYSRVVFQHQLWIVNYYVISLSNNLSNENIKTGVSREMIFPMFLLLRLFDDVLT